MKFWCWSDVFLYRECCDTSAYGPGGFEICFAQSQMTFDACCPAPADFYVPRVGGTRQWVVPWFEGEEEQGCRSRFYWLPAALAYLLSFGPAYHPRTGDVLDASAGSNASASKASVEGDLKRHFEMTKQLSFASFLRAARRYYERSEVSIELSFMLNVILGRFGDSWTQCPQAALLAVFLKIEAIYPNDVQTAASFEHAARLFLARAIGSGRVPQVGEWDARHALASLQKWELGQKQPQASTVDFVLPLCGLDDVRAAADSLRAALGAVSTMPKPRSVLAEMTLHVYDTCGVIAHHFSGRNLSAALLAELPGWAPELFGGGRAGKVARVLVVDFTEQVPAGDLAAYMHHIARHSAGASLADVTLLLHADFAEHIRPLTFAQIFSSLISGSWPHDDVDFLYLGWRHSGPNQDGGRRVASEVRVHCSTEGPRLRECFNQDKQPLAKGASFGDFSPVLFENIWRWTFGCDFDVREDDFGGYDFSQLLVSRRAAQARSADFWSYLARKITDRSSFQLLPGTRFISRRVDLSPQYKFNKGVSIWFEHMWHLLFDPRFFPEKPDAGSLEAGGRRDLRYFTHMGDPKLPLGFRISGMGDPDSVMLRHYWLSADEQCSLFKDRQGCHLARLSAIGSQSQPGSARYFSQPLWRAPDAG